MRYIFLMTLLCGQVFADMERFLLITGCARSGTYYISDLLRQTGLDIAHENIGQHGTSSWTMAVTDTQTPWGPGSAGIHYQHIFHQVRDPIKVISSVYTKEPRASWEYIIKHIPQILSTDPKIVKCAKYWYYWNLRAEAIAELTYRVEDIEIQWDKIEKILGLILDKSALDRIPKDTNTNGPYKRNITWKTLKLELNPALYFKIRELAIRYGYKTED